MDKYIKTDALESWLYQVAINNIDEPITFDKACVNIVERLKTGGYRFFEETDNDVEIVRCKDCENGKNNFMVHGLCLCTKDVYDKDKGEIPMNILYPEDHFCGYGARKTDND